MSAVWKAMKKSLHCRSDVSEVYDPKRIRSKKSCCKPNSSGRVSKSGSCRPALKGVFHGNKRSKADPTICSPMSVRSSDLINPVIHHVRFTSSEIDVGGLHRAIHPTCGSPLSIAPYAPVSRLSDLDGGIDSVSKTRSPLHLRMSVAESNGSPFRPVCYKCGEPLARKDAEAHFLTMHAVSEVVQGDSTRKIIEMIFMTGWTGSENRPRIERILKVHNPQTKLAHFEEYREMVKIRAHRLHYSKKHPRCLADGNELLRFYGTTLACTLGQNGCSSLCTLQICNVCSILRRGFSSQKGLGHSVLGILTTSTSEIAYKSIEIDGEDSNSRKAFRKALILCRVIAGRVQKPMVETSSQELVGDRKSGFDSLAGKLGTTNSHMEELYLLNSAALLPCFVIVCKSWLMIHGCAIRA